MSNYSIKVLIKECSLVFSNYLKLLDCSIIFFDELFSYLKAISLARYFDLKFIKQFIKLNRVSKIDKDQFF